MDRKEGIKLRKGCQGIERMAKLLRKTRSKVRVEGETGESFWIARGVRQGCRLSPVLFNLLVADMEKEMRKIKWGGVKLGEDRVYTLAYSDDMVLLAENKEEMRSMIESLEEYLEWKGLELNTEKAKRL